MNNQVKLVDAEKLKMWILQNDAAEAFMESVDSSDAFSNLCFAIDNGAFDPDTPPVPTIKPGDKDAAIANLIADLLFAFINKDEHHPHDFELAAFENAVSMLRPYFEPPHFEQIKYHPKLFVDHLERMRRLFGNE